jgi:hypothetical protein
MIIPNMVKTKINNIKNNVTFGLKNFIIPASVIGMAFPDVNDFTIKAIAKGN